MTRTYEYTFTVYEKKAGTDGRLQSDWISVPVTLRKRVTDRMEERDSWKAIYAAHYFTDIVKREYGKRAGVCAQNIKEV